MTTKKTELALRVLTAINQKEEPNPNDVLLLRAYCAEDRDLPADEMACIVIQQTLNESKAQRDGDLSQRHAILEKVRNEMEQAKALYDSAKEAYERLRKELEDEGPERLESKFQQALDTKDFLRSLYQDSVKRYNEHLLDNLGPEPIVRKAGS